MASLHMPDDKLDQWILGTSYSAAIVVCEIDSLPVIARAMSYGNIGMWSVPATACAVGSENV
jgi:hypothetical protein